MELVNIDTVEMLLQIPLAPEGNYRLMADIDLDGAVWKPFDFNGTLDGNGKSIYNFRIIADGSGNQGFFGCVGEKGTVKDLTLKNLSLVVDANAVAAGAVAGVNRGKIENCTVGADAPYVATPRGNRNALTGYCDDSTIYADRTSAAVGAVAGINAGVIIGAVSYLRLLGKPQELCAQNTGTAEGLYRDVSRRTELLPRSAIDMRKEIVAHMETQGNFRWIPAKDMAFTSAYTGSYKIYEKNQVHYGLPYTQKNGSVERARVCLTEDDYVADWVPEYSDASPLSRGSEAAPWDVYMGNDCSGAVYWSWQRVCPSIEFGYTGDIVPTEENQKLYGVLPLGDYRADTLLTDEVIRVNTPERITECYTRLLLGDAIVMRDPGYGHIRLVARDPMVMRRQDGTIDIDASYVPTHEHGVGKGSSGRLSTWQLDARYTFRDLLDTHYIPITNRDLVTGAAAPVQIQAEGIDAPFRGQVRTNYRIISTTVELEHMQTGERFKSVEFTALDKDRFKESPKQDGYARSTIRCVELSDHLENLRDIPAGEYTYTVSVQLSTGNRYIVRQGSYIS
ncbi:MAG: hypothetical protein IJO45_03685 [Oscillospiraceae bacterium]|nr:hypothetical protein [Oscillospiraceae bacterium]